MTPSLIIILYHPSPEDIAHLRNLAQLWPGCIVDNSEEPCFGMPEVGRMHYICNSENLGIAEAQSIGIRKMLEQGVTTHLVFLDQDTRIPTDYPSLIAEEYERISLILAQQSAGTSSTTSSPKGLALLGPSLFNLRSGEQYRSVVHHDQKTDADFIPRRDVISTGSCIRTDVLQHVGLPETELFIDYVDFEWCWRAQSQGYVCGITPRITIGHQVGLRELTIGSYRVIISAPFRYFYQYRNYLWLLRRRYVPLQWKLATGIKQLARLIYFPLLVKGGRRCFHFMWRGYRAALRPSLQK